MLIRSGEIPSLRQTSIDTTNDCATKSGGGELVRGSDPPSGQSVHHTTGDTWRAPARRLIQTHRALLCRKHAIHFSIPLRWQKIGLFSGLGEERTTPRATSRPLDHGSTWRLWGLHLHSPALPDTNRVGRELILCRDRRPIVEWALLISVLTGSST